MPGGREQAFLWLSAAYEADVLSRRRAFVSDPDVDRCVRQLAAFLTSDSHKFGVMLCGTCGNGKTTLLRALQSAQSLLFDSTEGVLSVRERLTVVSAREVAWSVKSRPDFLRFCSAPLLAVDDMGTEPVEVIDFGNVYRPLSDLIESRYENRLFTVISTNLTAEEFQRYGARMCSRFNEMLEVIIFPDKKFREL